MPNIVLKRIDLDAWSSTSLRHDAMTAIETLPGTSDVEVIFEGKDVCCSVVTSLEDALQTPHFKHRDLLAREIHYQGQVLPALPVPVDGVFRADQNSAPYPAAVSA